MTRNGEELRAGGAGGAHRRKALAALLDNQEDVDERLNIVDDGRLTEQAELSRERRLVPRFAAVPLDRVEKRRFFAADVGAGAASDLDVQPNALAGNVAAQESPPAPPPDCT